MSTTPSHPHHQSPVIRWAVLALSLAAFGSGISQRVTDALLPVLMQEFSLPLAAVSWVITCFTGGYAMCQLFFGPLGDRFGKYLVIAWACGACAVAAFLCALAPGLGLLLAARTLAGAMTAAIIPLSMAWIGDVVPYDQRQPVLARFLVGQIAGVAAGQLLGGMSADHFGRRVPFLLLTVLFSVAMAGMFAMRKRLPPAALLTRPKKSNALRHLLQEFSAVLSRHWARVVLLTAFLEGALVFGPFAYFATHLHRTLAISLTASGSILMCFGAGGLSFAVLSRRLVLQLGEVGLVRGGGFVLLMTVSVIAFAPGVVPTALACLMMGLGFYMLHNTLQTNATQMAPERRGAAVSAFALSFFIGQSCGVAIAGWGIVYLGARIVIIASAVGMLLTAMNFMREKQRALAA